MTSKKNTSIATKRIVLDCSYIIGNDPGSGIQRVVRNILDQSGKLKLPAGHSIDYVAWSKGAFHRVEWPPGEVAKTPNYTQIVLKTANALKLFLPSAIFAMMRRLYIAIRPSLKVLISPGQLAEDQNQQAVTFNEGDVLLLLDSSWHIPYWREVGEAKRCGAKIGMVAYDLIPVKYPQFCDAGIIAAFNSWINKSLYWSDFCLAISEATAKDVRAYAKTIRSRAGKPIRNVQAFKLGVNLDRSSAVAPRKFFRDMIKELSAPYVSVGTIEPRKNQGYLIDVFEQLWAKRLPVQLCIVGRKGWQTDRLIKRIKSHPQYQKRLFWFNDLNDGELGLVYKKAKALIIPSIQEGYGLPIVEALSHRKPVFASDIPVFREVGGKNCTYFDLNKPDELIKMLELYTKRQFQTPRIPGSINWPTWRESTEEFIEKVIKLAG